MTKEMGLIAVLAFALMGQVGHSAEMPATRPATRPLYEPGKGPLRTVMHSLKLHDGKREKDLAVLAVFPLEGGPYPVIVFSHGASAMGLAYLPLLEYWATHGYVVLAPTHADSLLIDHETLAQIIEKIPTDCDGWKNRVADIELVIDSIPSLPEQEKRMAGKMDEHHLGMGGHSYGGFTAELISGATVTLSDGSKDVSFADKRVLAVEVLSGLGRYLNKVGLHDHSWDHVALPMLVETGTKDGDPKRPPMNPQWQLEPYAFSPAGDKFSVNIEGVNHFTFVGEGGLSLIGETARTQKKLFTYIQMTTLAFWDAYLKNDAPAKKWLLSHQLMADTDGVVKMENK